MNDAVTSEQSNQPRALPSIRNMLFGEALIARGYLTKEQLDTALNEQKGTRRKLTHILIEKNFVTDEQVGRVLAEIHVLPFIDLRLFDPRQEDVLLLSEAHARKYRVIVLERREFTYLLGVADPADLVAQDYISSVLERPLEIAVVSNDQLTSVFDRIYSSSQHLNEFAKAVESDIERGWRVVDINKISATVADEDAPVVKLLQTIFKEASQLGASDIHIEPQERKLIVRYRIDGVMQTRIEADTKIAPPLMVKLKLMAGLEISEKRIPQDGRISLEINTRQLDIRLSTLPTQFGESVVMRILVQGQGMRDLESMGMPKDLLERFTAAVASPNGIILATGPTGSGKTTTLYGALAKLNTPKVKILTAEDPIEYHIAGINQVQVNEKIGLSFPRVLRSFLRQDPDIILVGEIRDSETAEIAVRAAMTGHLVLSTLHTNDAVSAPSRLMDLGVPSFLVASTLRAVLSQRLLRRICDSCAEPYSLQPDEEDWVLRYFTEMPTTATLKHGKGCPKCNGQGFRGRIGVYELLEMSRPLAIALHGNNPTEFEAVAREQIGTNSLAHQGLRLAFEGKTTIAEAIRHTMVSV
jgi:MSHA biogenesis protein MshE